MAKNLPHLGRHSQKKIENQKFYFAADSKTCWVFANHLESYGVAKWREISGSMRDF